MELLEADSAGLFGCRQQRDAVLWFQGQPRAGARAPTSPTPQSLPQKQCAAHLPRVPVRLQPPGVGQDVPQVLPHVEFDVELAGAAVGFGG